MFGMSELAVILLVVIVVLGIRKLPELTRSAGKAARIFKSETGALKERNSRGGPAGSDRIVQGTVVEEDTRSPRS